MYLYGANPLDLVIVSVLLTSGAFALIRGFTREVISLLSWIVSILCVFLFSAPVGIMIADGVRGLWGYGLPAWLGVLFASIIIFLAILLFFAALNQYILRGVEKMGLGSADRLLGFLFGVLRGYVICAGLLFLFALLVPEGGSIPMVQSSRLRLLLDATILWASPVVAETVTESIPALIQGETDMGVSPPEALEDLEAIEDIEDMSAEP